MFWGDSDSLSPARWELWLPDVESQPEIHAASKRLGWSTIPNGGVLATLQGRQSNPATSGSGAERTYVFCLRSSQVDPERKSTDQTLGDGDGREAAEG